MPDFCEGIVFDHDGHAYISHGKFISVFDRMTKRVCGLKLAHPMAIKCCPTGPIWCAMRPNMPCCGLTQMASSWAKRRLNVTSRPLREPNDLTLDAKGGFYFTDPGPYDPEKAASDGTVHYVDPQGKTYLVTQGLAYPNGIVIRPDGKTLLVGESLKNRILTYGIPFSGKTGPMKTFANLPVKQGEQIDNQPDGMCLDAEGLHYSWLTLEWDKCRSLTRKASWCVAMLQVTSVSATSPSAVPEWIVPDWFNWNMGQD